VLGKYDASDHCVAQLSDSSFLLPRSCKVGGLSGCLIVENRNPMIDFIE
jgi:hypothetical protein